MNKPADYHLDATLSQSWDFFPEADWICTNPPYSEFVSPIIKNAYQKARVGVAAFLLTSFLEPCDDRADFLQQHPPSLVLIMCPAFVFVRIRKASAGLPITSPSHVLCGINAPHNNESLYAQLIELLAFTKPQTKRLALNPL